MIAYAWNWYECELVKIGKLEGIGVYFRHFLCCVFAPEYD